jgi:hypothetical protein
MEKEKEIEIATNEIEKEIEIARKEIEIATKEKGK